MSDNLFTDAELSVCDLCLVVGTSSVVYPAAMFAPQVAERGVPVAEFNLEATPATYSFGLVPSKYSIFLHKKGGWSMTANIFA